MSTLPLRTLVCGLVGLALILGAYVGLVVAGHDPDGLSQFLAVLGGLVGLGAHNEVRMRQADNRLQKVERQTNGELDRRIRAGVNDAVTLALTHVGYDVRELRTDNDNNG